MLGASFLGTTKVQILTLLRRAPRTIHELAEALHLTDNAVRSHVVGLERDRLVQAEGRRPGARKPSVTYALGPGADQLFAKPYAPVLGSLIEEVRARLGEAELVQALRAIGQRQARERLGQVVELRGKDRVEAAARLVNDLGGLAEVEGRGDSYVITGYSCPLVAVVADHPEACQLTQAFLEGVLDGGTVRECCRRGEDVSCRFEIDLHPAAASHTAN